MGSYESCSGDGRDELIVDLGVMAKSRECIGRK